MLIEVMRDAFTDELEKIAGALTGHVRAGRRPIGVRRLMEKGSQHTKVSDIVKLSGLGSAVLVPAVIGAGAYHYGRQANEDRKLGRQLRLQQVM